MRSAKIKGTLRLKEVAEGGTVTHELALTRVSLWNKDRDPGPCPTSLEFSLSLPATFNDGKDDYVRRFPLSAQCNTNTPFSRFLPRTKYISQACLGSGRPWTIMSLPTLTGVS